MLQAETIFKQDLFSSNIHAFSASRLVPDTVQPCFPPYLGEYMLLDTAAYLVYSLKENQHLILVSFEEI